MFSLTATGTLIYKSKKKQINDVIDLYIIYIKIYIDICHTNPKITYCDLENFTYILIHTHTISLYLINQL